MTIRKTAIAKLQQLPEPLLQQVTDFIDGLTDSQQHRPAIGNSQSERADAWGQWFESVDRLKMSPTESVNTYQQILLTKYRQQGLEL